MTKNGWNWPCWANVSQPLFPLSSPLRSLFRPFFSFSDCLSSLKFWFNRYTTHAECKVVFGGPRTLVIAQASLSLRTSPVENAWAIPNLHVWFIRFWHLRAWKLCFTYFFFLWFSVRSGRKLKWSADREITQYLHTFF